MATTINYGYTQPSVGGSDGTWGSSLNQNWEDVDADLKAVSDAADAALPLSGGTMTGTVKMKVLRYSLSDKGSALSGAVTLDLSNADFFKLNQSGGGNITISFSNPPATGTVAFFTVEITGSGTLTVSWPAAVKWAGGSAPNQSDNSNVDVYTFYTTDGGTTYYGARVLEDAS